MKIVTLNDDADGDSGKDGDNGCDVGTDDDSDNIGKRGGCTTKYSFYVTFFCILFVKNA